MPVLQQSLSRADMNDYLKHLAYAAWTGELGPHSAQLKWRRAIRAVIAEIAEARRLYPTGSSARGTAIAGFSDVDHFVVLPGNPPSVAEEAMQALYGAVSRILGRANIPLLDAPSVTLVDPYDGRLLDFVPAFRDSGGGFQMYDEERGRYLWTNPLSHVAYISSAGAYARTLVRLLKSWKYAHSHDISSIYLELFCASRVLPSATGDLLADLTATFERLHQQGLQPLDDPTSRGCALNASNCEATATAELRAAVEAALQTVWRIDWALRSGAQEQGRDYARTLLMHGGYLSYLRRRKLQQALVDGNRQELRGLTPTTYLDRIEERRERSKWVRQK